MWLGGITSEVTFVHGKKQTIKLGDAFKEKYFDEYTGEELDRTIISEATAKELHCINQKVWQFTTAAEAAKKPGAIVVGGRWVACNKGDLQQPKMRARYLTSEVATEHDDSFYAATPPLEPMRLPVSMYAQLRRSKGTKLKISVMDVTKNTC